MSASNARAVVPLASLADLAHDADFATWLEGQRNANTRRAYASDLRQFSAYLAQKHPALTDIKNLTLRECFGYPRWLREDMGYSVATVQRKLSAAKSICGYLTALGVWATSPMATVRAYRVPEISPRVALTGEEARRLLDAARGDVRDYAILLTLGTLALRRSELANMRCNDISRRDGHIALHVIGKGGSDAYLPIPPHVAEAIRA